MSGYEVTSRYGVTAPAGTPNAVVGKIQADVTTVLRMSEMQRRLNDMEVEAAPTSRDVFAPFVRAETVRWVQVIEEAGIAQQ